AGIAAVARALLCWVERDTAGNISCAGIQETLVAMLAEGVAPDFIWPPKPGSCSTAHWAPGPSPSEVAAYLAARDERADAARAKLEAEVEARVDETIRRLDPR